MPAAPEPGLECPSVGGDAAPRAGRHPAPRRHPAPLLHSRSRAAPGHHHGEHARGARVRRIGLLPLGRGARRSRLRARAPRARRHDPRGYSPIRGGGERPRVCGAQAVLDGGCACRPRPRLFPGHARGHVRRGRPARVHRSSRGHPRRGLRRAHGGLAGAAPLLGAGRPRALDHGRSGRRGHRELAPLHGDPVQPRRGRAPERCGAHAASHARRPAPPARRPRQPRADLQRRGRRRHALRRYGHRAGQGHPLGHLARGRRTRARRAVAAAGGAASRARRDGSPRAPPRRSPRARAPGPRRLPRARAEPRARRSRPRLRGAALALRGGDAAARRLCRPARHGPRQRRAVRGGGEQEDAARAGLRLDHRRLSRGRPLGPYRGLQPPGRRPPRHLPRRSHRAALSSSRGGAGPRRRLGDAGGAGAGESDRGWAARGRPRRSRGTDAGAAHPRLARGAHA